MLKPMALSGIDRAVTRLNGHAATVETVVTTTGDPAVARVGAVRLASGDLLADDLVADPIPVEDEAIAVPQGNGLGFDEPRDE